MNQQARPRATVALFRAEGDAAETADRLAALGFACVRLPAIEPRPLAAAPRLGRYDAVLATSANAFLASPPVAPGAPLFVVGSRAGRAAEAAGWRLGAPPAPDAEALAATLVQRLAPGARLLYLAGRDRKPVLEAALAGVYALETAEVYVAEARPAWPTQEARALRDANAALHYSRRSAAQAAELAERSGVAAPFRALRHVCLSQDVAEPIVALGGETVVAATPDEPALLAALRATFPRICFD
jgi:uroporphyrinogen-III synthase